MATLQIKGKVSQPNGTPIPGIQIAVTDTNPNDHFADVVTDSTGNYAFDAYSCTGNEAVTVTATDNNPTASGGVFAGANKSITVPPITAGTTYSREVDFT